ncbi:MAG: OmpA family protein [Victivallaceae bacterium]|nr:OmpA family protein [Victivallaceae bacterium]
MKLNKILTISLLAGILVAGSGCSWFDSKIPEKHAEPIPVLKTELEDGAVTKWTDSIKVDSMAGAAKDGWQPVKSITFPTIYFAYDRSVIGLSERHKLQQVAKYLKENKMFGLIIEGHCDENGSAEYNRALGERRSIAAKDYLTNSGISTARIKTISYGEDRLAHKEDHETAHAKNRRAELILARMR